jgi:DNA-binding MarR family transcriptional regulator
MTTNQNTEDSDERHHETSLGAKPMIAASPAVSPEHEPRPQRPSGQKWTLLSNHGHVLVAIARHPDARVNDLATAVGITPRATLAILRDLESAGYLTRTRVGRRNEYSIDTHQHFRHPANADHEIGELLRVLTETETSQS